MLHRNNIKNVKNKHDPTKIAAKDIDISDRRRFILLIAHCMGVIIGFKYPLIGWWWVYLLYIETGMLQEFEEHKGKLNHFPSADYKTPKHFVRILRHYYFYDKKLPKVIIQAMYTHIIFAIISCTCMAVTFFMFYDKIAFSLCVRMQIYEVISSAFIDLLIFFFFYFKIRWREL